MNKLIEKTDPNTYFLVGDLGFSVVEDFSSKYPKQYLNVGVAEQNMAGIAAGLAMDGNKVFTYSIANFNTMRCLEQIRNDICYHNLDVTTVSVGGGFVYGSAGYSHHAIQDISIMGVMPNMSLLLPADASEVNLCMDYVFKTKGPKYLRIGKNGEKDFYSGVKELSSINCINPDTPGNIAILTVGTILSVASDTLDILNKEEDNFNVFSCPIIDKDFSKKLKNKMEKYDTIFTIEEHITPLGFGSMVREILADTDKKIISFGVNKDNCKLVGDGEYLRNKMDLDPKKISEKITKFLGN